MVIADIVEVTIYKKKWENYYFAALFNYIRYKKWKIKIKDIKNYFQYSPQVLTCKEVKVDDNKLRVENITMLFDILFWVLEIDTIALLSITAL